MKRYLKQYDFKLEGQKGSHQQYKGFVKGVKRRVTVLANKRDFEIKTFQSMVRQSGLEKMDFLRKR